MDHCRPGAAKIVRRRFDNIVLNEILYYLIRVRRGSSSYKHDCSARDPESISRSVDVFLGFFIKNFSDAAMDQVLCSVHGNK